MIWKKRKSLPRKPWSSEMLVDKTYCFQWSLQLSIPQKLGSFYSFMGAAVQLCQSESCFKGIFPGSRSSLAVPETNSQFGLPTPQFRKFHLNQPLILRGFRYHNPSAHSDDWKIFLPKPPHVSGRVTIWKDGTTNIESELTRMTLQTIQKSIYRYDWINP